MKIFLKSLFAVLFLVATNIQLFAGYNQASREEKIRLIQQNHTRYEFDEQETSRGNQIVKEWIWSKPGKKWLGISWTNIIRKYKEIRTIDNHKFLNNDIINQTDYNPISTTEFSKDTKGLIYLVGGCALLGLNYYFGWFKSKNNNSIVGSNIFNEK